MDRWDNIWNFINMTKRRRNNLDWRNIRGLHRDEVLKDQDGYPLNDFLINVERMTNLMLDP